MMAVEYAWLKMVLARHKKELLLQADKYIKATDK